MEALMAAAAARVVQSDLARRVSNWRQRIDPVLQVGVCVCVCVCVCVVWCGV